MQWNIHSNGSTVGYSGYAEGTALVAAAVELWRKYVEDAAPKNAEIAWDHLRVEIWLDSGRVILFPSPSPFRNRVERAACQITFPEVLASYNEISGSAMSDDEFERWAKVTEMKIANLVSEAAKQAHLPERLGRPQVRITYYSCGGEEGPIKKELLQAGK